MRCNTSCLRKENENCSKLNSLRKTLGLYFSYSINGEAKRQQDCRAQSILINLNSSSRLNAAASNLKRLKYKNFLQKIQSKSLSLIGMKLEFKDPQPSSREINIIILKFK